MPGELELVERFGVSRHTVREALRVLEDLGLIGRYKGIGTIVKSKDPSRSYAQTVHSPAELLQYPPDSKLTVMDTEQVKANRKLARLLDCTTGTAWTRIGALRTMKESKLPICWVDIYVIPEYGSVAKKLGRRKRPVFEVVEKEFDDEVQSIAIDIHSGTISEEIAGPLKVEPGTPSLTVVRRYVGRNHGQFEVSVAEHPAGRFNYSLKLERGWQADDGWVAG